MSTPVTPLDPASPQGIAVATRLAHTLGRIEYELAQAAGDNWGAGGTHPPRPRPPQPPTPPPREQDKAA